MDGVSGIAMRVTEIQSRLSAVATLRPPTRATTSPSTTSMLSGTSSASATSFATVLADAVSQTGTPPAGASPITLSSPSVPGRLNAQGVPAELAAYGNGRIPASALRSIAGTHQRLWAPAATSFESLLQAAQRDGVHIGITDSYRSYAEQVDLARRKGLYSQGGLAAQPGTSNHGWGRSVDLALHGKEQAWMRANADRFGFVNDVAREPWHWTYTPGL